MLSKFRVLDLCDNRGDFAGFLLAQMGAEVLALEPSSGQSSRHVGPYADGVESSETSLLHWAYNRGKKSVVISDPTELETLALSADVLIECGVFEIDLNHLRELNPSLITVSISPFGATGPKANWLGTDLTLSAAAGPMSLNGYADRAPVRISAPQVWVNAASEAVCAVLIALTHQQSSGQGQHIDVSAQEAMMLTAQGWLSP
ncbi:MAG TPA: carnitine dehydratase, partial [Acidimicrobiaceae bacterium]|nr:carnitine dehydratase [Acidimicrobiaceae bacterium]